MGHPDHALLNKPKPLKKGKITPILCITAGIAAFGSSVPHGWNTGVLNAPSNLIKDFLNESYALRTGYHADEGVLNVLWATTVSIYLVGGCIGALSVIWMADRFGRKRSILICHAFGFVAAILFATCELAMSFEMLILARFIVGIGCGAGSGFVPMYLTEVAPVNVRGAMGIIHQFGLTIGICLSQIVGLRQVMGHPDRWPYLLALTAVFCLVSMIVLPFLPESPRYLYCVKHDEAAATKALQRFRGTSEVTADMNEMQRDQEESKKEPAWTFRKLFRSRVLRLPLILVCFLNMAQQLSGINVIFYYSNGVFEDAGIADEKIQYAVLGTGLMNVAMTAISLPLVEKAGRKVLLIGGMFVMCGANVLITVALCLQSTIDWFSYVSIVCVMIVIIAFSLGLGSIPNFIGAELFKQGPRPPAMTLACLLNWVCNFIVGISFPSMETGMGPFSFVIFIIVLLLFALFILWKLPETKNKTYEEIYLIFQRGVTGHDEEINTNGYHDSKPFEILLTEQQDGDKPIYKPSADKNATSPSTDTGEGSALLRSNDQTDRTTDSTC